MSRRIIISSGRHLQKVWWCWWPAPILPPVLADRIQSTRELYGHNQTPMFLGNRNPDFFGFENPRIGLAPFPVVRYRDGSVQMDAGQAHGTCECDKFTISAVTFNGSTSSEMASSQSYCTAEVTTVRALTSTLKLPVTTFNGDLNTGCHSTHGACLWRNFPSDSSLAILTLRVGQKL